MYSNGAFSVIEFDLVMKRIRYPFVFQARNSQKFLSKNLESLLFTILDIFTYFKINFTPRAVIFYTNKFNKRSVDASYN